jgi:hypothetical protein
MVDVLAGSSWQIFNQTTSLLKNGLERRALLGVEK